MKQHTTTRGNPIGKTCVPAKMTVAAAVFLAIYGISGTARAQQAPAQPNASGAALEEITVTANRREQTVEAVPYSMSVVSMEQLDQSGCGGERMA